MTETSQELPVTGTAWRPSFLPLFVISHNNLAPRLAVSEAGLEIRIVTTNHLAWNRISRADVKKGIGSTYAVLSSGGGHYIAHFRDLSALRTLVGHLQARGVALSPAAEAMLTG